MNARRLMSNTASLPQSVCRTLSLPQNSRRVLWTDLNRSESRLLPLAPTRGPLLCACPWGRGPVWVRLGHSAMSARCPVCPKADRAGRFISTRLKLEQAALTAYTGQEDCNSHEAHGWGARHDTGGRLLLSFRGRSAHLRRGRSWLFGLAGADKLTPVPATVRARPHSRRQLFARLRG